jgi:hypothetical protein
MRGAAFPFLVIVGGGLFSPRSEYGSNTSKLLKAVTFTSTSGKGLSPTLLIRNKVPTHTTPPNSNPPELPVVHRLPFGCSSRNGVRIGGIGNGVEGAHAKIIDLVWLEFCVRESIHVRSSRADQRKGSIVRGTFDFEALLVTRVIRPAQINTRTRHRSDGESGGSCGQRGHRHR